MFSFGIIAENFEVFENDIFDCKLLWMVGKGEWHSSFTTNQEPSHANAHDVKLVPLFLTQLRSQDPIDPLKSLTISPASPQMSSIA